MKRNVAYERQIDQAVGQAVRSFRNQANMTLAELSRRIGFSVPTIQKVEDGNGCSLHVLITVADEFDTTLDALVPVIPTLEDES